MSDISGNHWQDLLDNLLIRATRIGDINKIQNIYSEEDLIRFFMNDYYKDKLLKWVNDIRFSSFWKKSKEKAKSLRMEGNQQFLSQDYEQCVRTYSESIKYAPIQSEELSLSFANRSAALVHMNNYVGALKDIDKAFEHGYPKLLEYKLYQRKGNSLMKLGKYQEAITEFNCAEYALQHESDVPSVKTFHILKAMKSAMSTCLAHLSADEGPPRCRNAEMHELPIPLCGTSEELSYASKALSLQHNEEKGRHIVALTDISVGDVLFVEKPFAFVLLPEHYEDRCHHCCNLFSAPLPCQQCSGALYCSELCRVDSWNEYHQWECCGGLDIAHSVGIAHLGLRVVLTVGSLSKHESLKKPFLLSDEGKERYSAVYCLLTHIENLSAEDRAAYALTAVCLLLYLVHCTNYFPKNTSYEGISNDILLIGGRLLRHICQLVCNGHAITAMQVAKQNVGQDVVDMQQVRIATAIFPSASMMNHSCDPNIINSFGGTSLIVKAYRSIKKGGEVFNCYGPNFRQMRQQERKEKLKAQYHFECMCEACLSDNDFLNCFTALKCNKCQCPLQETNIVETSINCNICRSSLELCSLYNLNSEASDLLAKGLQFLMADSPQEALQLLLSCCAIQETCMYRSHINHRKCLDGIAKCYAMLGNCKDSITFLQKTLPMIEEQFGSWSIEMAHEMQKLTDLMIHDLGSENYDRDTFMNKHAETQNHVQKTKQIFQLHYGPWNDSLQEVMKKEENLNSILTSINI